MNVLLAYLGHGMFSSFTSSNSILVVAVFFFSEPVFGFPKLLKRGVVLVKQVVHLHRRSTRKKSCPSDPSLGTARQKCQETALSSLDRRQFSSNLP